MRITVAAPLALVLALAACGGGTVGGDGTPSPGDTSTCLAGDPDCQDIPGGGTSTDTSVPTGALTVEDVVAAGSIDGPFTIRGYVFVADEGTAKICSAIAESYPPQCGGASLPVEGEIPGLDAFSSAQGLRWTDNQIDLVGTFDGTTFTLP